MYRIFIMCAVVMFIMLFDAKLSANVEESSSTPTSTETETGSNAELQKSFEETQKMFEKNHLSKQIKTPPYPTEKDIKNFPSPIAENEVNNSEAMSAYYTSVADAYEQEANKVHESVLKAFDNKTRNNQQIRMNAYRNENVKYAKDFTNDKGAASRTSSDTPFKSGKYVPSTIRRDSHNLQNKAFREAKARFDALNYKKEFYRALANQFKPSAS